MSLPAADVESGAAGPASIIRAACPMMSTAGRSRRRWPARQPASPPAAPSLPAACLPRLRSPPSAAAVCVRVCRPRLPRCLAASLPRCLACLTRACPLRWALFPPARITAWVPALASLPASTARSCIHGSLCHHAHHHGHGRRSVRQLPALLIARCQPVDLASLRYHHRCRAAPPPARHTQHTNPPPPAHRPPLTHAQPIAHPSTLIRSPSRWRHPRPPGIAFCALGAPYPQAPRRLASHQPCVPGRHRWLITCPARMRP